jgi:hypothetical protein
VQNGSGYASLAEINFGAKHREYKRDLTVKEYLLPIMNSEQQDGYEVSVNSEYNSSWRIWQVFNRNTGNGWSTFENTPLATILIAMPEAKICNLISVYPRSGYLPQAFGTFSLHGSNDGENWTELLAVTDISAWSTDVEKSWEVENDLAYSYYKIVATPYNSDRISVININLFHQYTTREY